MSSPGTCSVRERRRAPASAAGVESATRSETLARREGSDRKFEGRMILQADEAIPFHVLQKVMYTSQTVGFYDITLAVIAK